jgi:hypothetical protein
MQMSNTLLNIFQDAFFNEYQVGSAAPLRPQPKPYGIFSLAPLGERVDRDRRFFQPPRAG